jgi:hypothetical protein
MLKFSHVDEKLEFVFGEYVDFFHKNLSILIFISMTHFFLKLNNYTKRKPKQATYLQ